MVGYYVVAVSALDTMTDKYSNLAVAHIIVTTPGFSESVINSITTVSIDYAERLIFHSNYLVPDSYSNVLSVGLELPVVQNNAMLSGEHNDGASSDTRLTSSYWSTSKSFRSNVNYQNQTIDDFQCATGFSTGMLNTHPYTNEISDSTTTVSFPKLRLLRNSPHTLVFGLIGEDLQHAIHSSTSSQKWGVYDYWGANLKEPKITEVLHPDSSGSTTAHVILTFSY